MGIIRVDATPARVHTLDKRIGGPLAPIDVKQQGFDCTPTRRLEAEYPVSKSLSELLGYSLDVLEE
jgi:hypothetical protein